MSVSISHTYKQMFFSYVEKLCFCNIDSSFLRVQKYSKYFCDFYV